MTTNHVPHGGAPTAADLAERVLVTLLEHGRWNDAATCYPVVEDPLAGAYARLLLAAGRVAEAGAVLAAESGPADAHLAFVRDAHAVLTHDHAGLPQLVAAAAAPDLAADPSANLVMMRAARAAGRPQVAAHYATRLLSAAPGDVEAASVVVADLVATGGYLDAVHVIDRAEVWHCDDEPHPLDRALESLESSGEVPKAAALAVIGDHLHREADPTLPVSTDELASRLRWRTARRRRTPRVPVDWLVSTAAVVVVGAVGFAVAGSALPGVVCSAVIGLWLSRRPLPGVDPAGSQLVRALRNPTTRFSQREYHVADVVTLLVALCIALGVASTLPSRPSWLGPAGLVAGAVVALAATRGRRRWVRRERTRLLRPPLDPGVCCCLDLDRLHGDTARRYADTHLFPVHAVAGLSGWQLVQCLETYRYFLASAAAGLTIALAAAQQPAPHQPGT